MRVKAFQSAASHLAHASSGEAEHAGTANRQTCGVIRPSSFFILTVHFFPLTQPEQLNYIDYCTTLLTGVCTTSTTILIQQQTKADVSFIPV